VRVRPPTLPFFERPDGRHAHAGAFRQHLLGQTRAAPQPP